MASRQIYPWYNISQAAEYLSCSTRTVQRLVQAGRLKYHRPHGRRRMLFHRKYLDAYLLGYGTRISPSQRRQIENLHTGFVDTSNESEVDHEEG